jgi:hypothetical protein
MRDSIRRTISVRFVRKVPDDDRASDASLFPYKSINLEKRHHHRRRQAKQSDLFANNVGWREFTTSFCNQ